MRSLRNPFSVVARMAESSKKNRFVWINNRADCSGIQSDFPHFVFSACPILDGSDLVGHNPLEGGT